MYPLRLRATRSHLRVAYPKLDDAARERQPASPSRDDAAYVDKSAAFVARVPNAPVHDSPGSSRITSLAVRKSFGGHVIGSTATLRRFTTGSASPVKIIK
jgi:hypothetical protein